MSKELWALDAVETSGMIARREVSAVEVTRAHLARIDTVNPQLNAIVRRDDDAALSHAADVDAGKVTGELAGATMTTKINTGHLGFPNDNGIKAMANAQSNATHPVVRGLLDQGLTMVGRTNSPAFAMRFHTDNDLHGETLNPYAYEVSCGGSSGGAGVAVATGMCHIGQGNDIAGSVRWPATLNGVLGLRPTIGRMPTGGIDPNVPRGWGAANMSTNGPLARTMRDLRAGYRAMAAGDWADPLWVPAPLEFPRPAGKLKVALITEDGEDIDPLVIDAIRRVGAALADAGSEVVEATPPMTETYFSLWERLGTFDMTLGLAPMLGAIDDSGLKDSVTDWLTTLPPAVPATFMSALNDRDMVMRTWSTFLLEHHIVISPMMAWPSAPRAYDVSHSGAMAELIRAGRWGVNLSAVQVPALAFPAGLVNGVPIGVQMFAHSWREDLLLEAGDALEARFGEVQVVGPKWSGVAD